MTVLDPPAAHSPHAATALIAAITEEIRKAVVGQTRVIEEVLVALIASGHVLIEGVPGLGKTLLVRALGRTFRGLTGRIQFTPDLMPGDVTGHVMFDIRTGEMVTRRGPVFTNLLLADEINRAPAKTQAALLEVMQERQVTLEGTAMPLERPFMCLATQNPAEHEGTYPLPEAQLDRFLLQVRIDYPEEAEEVALVSKVTEGQVGDDLDLQAVRAVATPAQIVEVQRAAARVRVDPRVQEYAVRVVRATRDWPGVHRGAGPRGGLALVRGARARALLEGRDYVIPDDVKAVAPAALRHRVALSAHGALEGLDADGIIADVLSSVEAPRA